MRFRYLRDPVFLFALALYFANRWVFKRLTNCGFCHESLNDLLLIPFWVPIMLWAQRRAGLRSNDWPPQWYELLVPLVVWAALFEVLLPSLPAFRHLAIADPSDVLWYTVGA